MAAMGSRWEWNSERTVRGTWMGGFTKKNLSGGIKIRMVQQIRWKDDEWMWTIEKYQQNLYFMCFLL